MKLCTISYKGCWNKDGLWYSTGGFPLQINGTGSLFDFHTLIISQRDPADSGLEISPDIRVKVIRSPKGKDFKRKIDVLLHLWYYLSFLNGIIKESDVIQTPLPGDLPLLGALLGWINNKKLLIRYEGSWETNSRTTISNKITKSFLRLIAGKNNVVIVCGSGDTPPSSNMHWLYATSLTSTEQVSINPNYTREISNPPHLIYAGRLSPEKGLPILVQAMNILSKSKFKPLPIITIAGEGPDLSMLKKMINGYNLDNNFIFTGWLNRDSLTRQFLNSDLAIHPSYTESLCKAWLDALAHGLPVLATDVGSARDVFGANGERGWLVSPGDPLALATKLMQVLGEQRNWFELRKHCRAYAQTFSIENWTNQIGEICAKQWNILIKDGKLTL